MYNRHNQFDVTHAFAADFLFSHFHATTVAHDTLITNAFVLAAITFVVLDGTKNALAKQTVAFGLVRTVVDGFGFENLTIATL